MSRNIRSLILFFILLSVVFFLAGFRYGKFVERADKSYVPPAGQSPLGGAPTSTPPEPSPTQKPFAVVSYNGKICGILFLYPNYLEEQMISSQEAKLIKNNEFIRISCDKKIVDEAKTVYKTASPSAQTEVLNQNTKINIYGIGDTDSAVIRNPRSNQSIFVETTDNLTKLVLYSIEFAK